jgi:hypothetical protein
MMRGFTLIIVYAYYGKQLSHYFDMMDIVVLPCDAAST